MALQTAGATLSNQISFNAGTLIINGTQLAQLQDVTITLTYATKELRQLGSILMSTAPKRHGFKAGAKMKTKSVNPALFQYFMGSSNADGSGFDYTVVDGQNVLSTVSVTAIVNEDPTKSVQFQFTNAILSGNLGVALKTEDFAEVDLEIMAQNVTTVTNFSAQ